MTRARVGKDTIVKASIIMTAVVGVLALGGVAYAGKTIASPSIFAGTTQNGALCLIGNDGTTPIGVDVHIYDESGNTLNSSTACTSVDPNFICTVFVNVGFGQAYSCAVTAAGSTKHLRASFVLIHSGAPLRAVDLY